MAPTTDQLLTTRKEAKEAIENLRPLLRQISNAFIAQIDSEIVALSEAVRNLSNPEADPKVARRQEKILNEMQQFISELKLKPEKGRFKDLRRLRDVIDELNNLVQQLG
jgi:hypothetical protein